MTRLRIRWAAVCIALAWVCAPALAQTFKPYPGSKLDEKASSLASGPTVECQVYTTSDSVAKVSAFYKGLYKEFSMAAREAHANPHPASGKTLERTFFILDGEKDLAHSKFWLKVQWPYILGPDQKEVDVTVIQAVHKR